MFLGSDRRERTGRLELGQLGLRHRRPPKLDGECDYDLARMLKTFGSDQEVARSILLFCNVLHIKRKLLTREGNIQFRSLRSLAVIIIVRSTG